MASLKNICLLLGIPPSLWVTNSPTRIYEYISIKNEVDIQKDQMVLDFGCGDGLFAIELAKHPAHVLSVDMDKAVIDRAKKYIRYSSRKKRLDFRAGRIENLKLDSGSIDTVFCVCVLQLVDNLPKTLSEFHRILKPNGEIHATVDSFEYIQDESLKDAYKHTHQIVEYFTQKTIANYLENAGFSITSIEPILKGEIAKSHFKRYFQNNRITYSLPERFWMVKKIAQQDKSVGKDVPGAELLVRAKKLAV